MITAIQFIAVVPTALTLESANFTARPLPAHAQYAQFLNKYCGQIVFWAKSSSSAILQTILFE